MSTKMTDVGGALVAENAALRARVGELARERELIRKRLRHEVSTDEAYRLMDTIQQGWRDIAARKLREEHRRRQQAEARVEVCLRVNEDMTKELEQAEAKLAKAMEALRSIATNTCCDSCQEAGLVARAALTAARENAPAEPTGICPHRGDMAHVIPAGQTRCVLCYPEAR
jgi:septal ring factor EnvC (AmiA/AmiB activator)